MYATTTGATLRIAADVDLLTRLAASARKPRPLDSRSRELYASPMLFQMNGVSGEAVPKAIRELVAATERMPESTRALWSTRFEHVYGDLSGQRAVTVDDLRDRIGNLNAGDAAQRILFGLQTCFSLAADLIAVAATHQCPTQFLQDSARLARSQFANFLRDLSSGRLLASQGVLGASEAFDFEWYVEALDLQGVQALRDLLTEIAARWQLSEPDKATLDPVSAFYSSLFPSNLRHILGEVYTPGWLAELLVVDSAWEPGKRLLDPFGGSGVFPLAALRIARHLGVDPLAVLPDLCMIDLNPLACSAARANLVLGLRDRLVSSKRDEVSLPVISGDALAPALLSQHAKSRQGLFPESPRIAVDGELLSVPLAADGTPDRAQVATGLARYGIYLPRWIDVPRDTLPDDGRFGVRDRRFWEQLAVLALRPADVIATNPPWVGWEYISRPYRAYLDSAWTTYDLFTARGRDASFLKEDLSTLALITAWDRYLRTGGVSVAVVRANAMTSTLAARGLRRLSVFATDVPLRLDRVRLFEHLRVFPSVQVETATWQITKGEKTEFPVRVLKSRSERRRWQPRTTESLAAVDTQLRCEDAVAERIAPDDLGSRWVIGRRDCVLASRSLGGNNPYVGRTGVFTGGANAVYYLKREDPGDTSEAPYFSNLTEGAKRDAPSVRVRLESSLVYEVIRGRDLTRWSSSPGALLLLPHTRESRMRALPPMELELQFPRAWSYLSEMRSVLDARKGFTEWERAFRKEAFYAVQRVGEYTFAPYKVAWRYIANDFLCAVIGPAPSGRPRVPNDKIMFVGIDDPAEAYYLCGILSSDPVRWKIVAYSSGTQISANAIEPVGLPRYDSSSELHSQIATACRLGHAALAMGQEAEASECLTRINAAVQQIWRIEAPSMGIFRQELERVYRTDWPQLRVPVEAVRSPRRLAEIGMVHT